MGKLRRIIRKTSPLKRKYELSVDHSSSFISLRTSTSDKKRKFLDSNIFFLGVAVFCVLVTDRVLSCFQNGVVHILHIDIVECNLFYQGFSLEIGRSSGRENVYLKILFNVRISTEVFS